MYSTNLGQGVPPSTRLPFKRPRQASTSLMPHLLKTRFVSHIQPFATILPSAVAFPVRIPGPQRAMGPRSIATPRRPAVSSVPKAATAIPSATPALPAVPGGGVKGFGANGLGAGPYTIMATGAWSPYAQTVSRIRSGVAKAPQMVRAATSPYTLRNLPAGGFKAKRAY